MSAAAPAQRTISQNRHIHKLAADLAGLSQLDPELVPKKVLAVKGKDLKEQWRIYLTQKVSGQEHSSQLTTTQARQWVQEAEKHLQKLRDGLTGVKQARASNTISPAMQQHIGKLLEAIAWLGGRYASMAGSPAKLRQFCEHYLKQPWPQTEKAADDLIEALKSILKRSLPDKQALVDEFYWLNRGEIYGNLNDFGRVLVSDCANGRRRMRWGPLQWYWLHRTYLETKENHREEGKTEQSGADQGSSGGE